MNLSRQTAYLFLFAGMAVVGVYVALSKPLVAAIPVFLLAGMRFAIAAVALLPWTAQQTGDAPLSPSLWRTLFVESLFGNFLFSVCMLYGVSLTSATSAGVILATIPAMTAVFSALLLKEHLGLRALLAIACSVSGIVVLQFARTDAADAVASPSAWLGNLLMFGAVCCEALYVVIGKRLTVHLSAKRISALINLIGLALVLPFALWQARGFDFGSVSANIWTLLVFYAVAASMITTWLWLTGLKFVPANHAGVFTIALPLAATLVGVAFLGERFTMIHAIAFAFAVAGVLLMTTQARPNLPPPADNA